MINDLEPGPRGSVPGQWAGAGGRVFLAASWFPIGNELWTICPEVTTTFTVSPSTVRAGVPANLTLTAKTAQGVTAACYGGYVTFNSYDSHATLPSPYSFHEDGDGSVTLPFTFRTDGTPSLVLDDVQNQLHVELPITVIAGPAAAATSKITASKPRILATGASTSQIVVTLKDQFGHPLTSSDGDTVALGTTAGSLGGVTDNGNGTFTATLTSSINPGTATITGTLNGVTIGSSATVQFLARFPVKGDNDNDGKGDVIWRHATTGANYLWKMSGTTVTAVPLPGVPDLNWKIVGVADYDGDGNSDYFWRYTGNNDTYLWRMNGASASPIPAASAPTYPPNVNVVATGDVNGDGRSDLIWRHPAFTSSPLWLMNGAARTQSNFEAPALWKIAGMGDVDGDGRDDVIWYYPPTGLVYVWLMNGVEVMAEGALPSVPDTEWQIAGVADFSGDGKADLFWRRSTGETYLWQLNGISLASSGFVYSVADTGWKIAAIADFNGDARADIFWRHDVTGGNYLWEMNGTNIITSAPLPAVPDLNWQVVGPK
ncbi:MAG TPA: invasin domain 3-containing protein, partial [Thermoanaerobaculia bacterium]|nr:invasin domain 3-containing protein [Thermoanaerobaculia bacterium]